MPTIVTGLLLLVVYQEGLLFVASSGDDLRILRSISHNALSYFGTDWEMDRSLPGAEVIVRYTRFQSGWSTRCSACRLCQISLSIFALGLFSLGGLTG